MRIISFCIVLVTLISCAKSQKETAQAYYTPEVNLSSGILQRIDSFPTVNVAPRTVDVWLPEGYNDSKKYAVLYMHDGQMLFDETTTWNKQEWKVDELASQLMKEGSVKDFIVVAIWNISEIRWQDYFPQKAFDLLSEEAKNAMLEKAKENNFDVSFNADAYLKFITQEVKPYIDQTYAVYTDATNTFVAGSSMGGLISMYAMFEYPEVFGGAACISTHWPGATPMENNPIPPAFFEYMKSNEVKPENQKFYFDYGTETLDAYYPQYADEVNKIFKEKGFDDSNFQNLKFDGAAHDEISWAKRLDIPLTFLLKK